MLHMARAPGLPFRERPMWIPFFRRRPAAAPEAKSLGTAASFAELIGLHLPGRAGARRSVSRADALRTPAFGQGAGLIAEAVAGADVVSGLPGRANEWSSWPDLIRDMILGALIYDEGSLAYLTRRPSGEVLEVIQPPLGGMTVAYDPSTGEPQYHLGGRPWPRRDVIHVRPLGGVSAFSRAHDAISLAMDAEDFARSTFANAPGGILTITGNPGQERLDKILTSIRDRRDAGVLALYDGMSFSPISSTGVDSQLAEFRAAQVVEIARALNISSTFLNDLSRATWSNLESKHREFVLLTIEPWLRLLERELSEKLGTPVRFDRDDFSQADLASRATVLATLAASTFISPNEGRAWLGLGPREGGDEYANPHTARTGAAAPQGEAAEAEGTDE